MPSPRLLSGIVPSPPKAEDYPYQIVPGTDEKDFIGLRQHAGRRLDQGQAGSCVGQSGANAAELIELRGTGSEIPLSPQFPYDVGRIWEGRSNEPGMYQRDMLDVLRKCGIPPLSVYPYTGEELTGEPTDAVYAAARARTLLRYELLDLKQSPEQYTDDFSNAERAIKSALSEGCPVIISLHVGQRIFDLQGPLAQQDYPLISLTNPYAGAHDVVVLEYSKLLGGFIYENSWDRRWGDDGFGLLKTRVLQNVFEARLMRGMRINGTDYYIEPRFLSDEQIRDAVNECIAQNAGDIEAAAWQIWSAMIQYGITSAHLEAVMGWTAGSVDQYARDHGWL